MHKLQLMMLGGLAWGALACGESVTVDVDDINPATEAPPTTHHVDSCDAGGVTPAIDNVRDVTELIAFADSVPSGALISKALLLGIVPAPSPNEPSWSLGYLFDGAVSTITTFEEPHRPAQMLTQPEGVYMIGHNSAESRIRLLAEDDVVDVAQYDGRYPTEHRLINTATGLYFLDGHDHVNVHGFKGTFAYDDLPAAAFVLHGRDIFTLEGRWHSPCDGGHCAHEVERLTLRRYNRDDGSLTIVTDALCSGGSSHEDAGVEERLLVLGGELVFFDGVDDFFIVDVEHGSLTPLVGLGTLISNVFGRAWLQHDGWIYAGHFQEGSVELVRFRAEQPRLERLARLDTLDDIGLIAVDSDRLVFSHRDGDRQTHIAQLSLE